MRTTIEDLLTNLRKKQAVATELENMKGNSVIDREYAKGQNSILAEVLPFLELICVLEPATGAHCSDSECVLCHAEKLR
jgi:uncharacterized membrane protein